ncbi:MAG: LptF/LptG family permease [Kiritimatiellales bacterium]|nr:LptF/LptG family permease [Kiritimatiellales bacterium]
MKILTKYLLKSLFQPLFYCLLGFSLIFIIDDLFNNFSDFLENGVRPQEILYYYSQVIPSVFVIITPVCLLLAMLYSLSRLTRHSEITAMRAGGVSIYRIVMPFIGVGVLATLCTAYINEKIAPNAAWRAEKFLDYQKAGRNDKIFFARNVALKSRNHVWMVQSLDTRDHSMYHVELIEQRPDGSDALKIQADKALWLDGRWWFMDLTLQAYKENGDLSGPSEMLLQKEMRDLRETPQTFMAEIKDPQYLSASEMRRYLRSKKDVSSDTRARFVVDMHSRLSAPFACLIVTLIGVPIGAHSGRRGAFAGIMVAVMLFFTFYILQLTGQALGKQEYIAAWLGGWLPVIIFGMASPLFIHRMR